jgi:hypothetical protein
LITVALTATIDSTSERIWRALVDPAERLLWDDRILGEISPSLATFPSRRARFDRPGDPGRRHRAVRPEPLRRTRWRFRLGGVPLVMVDEVLSVERHERLHGRISIGSMRFDETITIHAESDPSGPRTRLGMKLVSRNSIAVFGELVPRLEVQRIAIEFIDTTLRQVRKHCETGGIFLDALAGAPDASPSLLERRAAR